MQILDGKGVAYEIKQELKAKTQTLFDTFKIKPNLAVISVGNDPASQVYIRNKQKACTEVGFNSTTHGLPESCSEEELLYTINNLNADNTVHGILVQLPLPKHIDTKTVLEAISPEKDVDCFHPINVGKLVQGTGTFKPCTPAGIIELLKYYKIPIEGKECVIIGRSDIVGKPLALMMTQENATVTLCHSKTNNLRKICKTADILVAAVGKPNMIHNDYIKDDAVVIDVGINRLEDGTLCGDVNFIDVKNRTSFITPVPGGVGPMTIAMLLKNTFNACYHLI